MPMLAQSLPVPAGGRLDGRRPRSRRARRWIGARLLACRAGNVVVEFALAAPVLMLLMLASAELARFVILHQKMDRVATTVSDLVSRAETINETEMADIFDAIGEVASPFEYRRPRRGDRVVGHQSGRQRPDHRLAAQRRRRVQRVEPSRRRGRRRRPAGGLRGAPGRSLGCVREQQHRGSTGGPAGRRRPPRASP